MQGIFLSDTRGAIFDLDGTLLDSLDVWNRVDVNFLGKRGIEVPADYAEAIAPMMFREVAEYTINRFHLNESPDDVINEWNSMAKQEYAQNVPLKDGADRVLKLLKKNGIKLGIATTNVSKVFKPCLERHGIYDMFDVITETDDVGVAKDKPDIYLHTAKKLRVNPSECIVFEDIVMALKSAKRGGFITVGIHDNSDWVRVTKEEFEGSCDHMVTSWDEVKKILE